MIKKLKPIHLYTEPCSITLIEQIVTCTTVKDHTTVTTVNCTDHTTVMTVNCTDHTTVAVKTTQQLQKSTNCTPP